KALLEGGANANYRSFSGKSAVRVAAQGGRAKILEVLLKALRKQRNLRRDLNESLWHAVVTGTVATVRILLNAGASSKALGIFEGKPVSALAMARKLGRKRKLQLLEAAARTICSFLGLGLFSSFLVRHPDFCACNY